MAAELEQFANQLEQRGHVEAAKALRSHITNLQEEHGLPDTLKIKREKHIDQRVQDAIQLGKDLNEQFGATASGEITLMQLRQYENNDWNKILKDMKLPNNNRGLIRSALGSAARRGIRTIADVRKRLLPDEDPLWTVTGLGDVRAAFLENVFTPKQAEEES